MTGGPAGIGFVAYADGELLLKGNRAVASATNHQAELRAAVFALDSIPEGQDVQLLSDSKYLIDGYNTYSRSGASAGGPTTASAPSSTAPSGNSSSSPPSVTATSGSGGRRGTMAPRATSTPTSWPLRRGGWPRASSGSTSSRRRSPQRSPDFADPGAKVPQVAGAMRRGDSDHGSHRCATSYPLPLRARSGSHALQRDLRSSRQHRCQALIPPTDTMLVRDGAARQSHHPRRGRRRGSS